MRFPSKRERIFCLLFAGVLGFALLTLDELVPHRATARAKENTCKHRLLQLYTALMLYENSYGEFPPSVGWREALFRNGFVTNLDTFVCPFSSKRTVPRNVADLTADKSEGLYVLVPESGLNEGKPRPLIRGPEPSHHKGGATLEAWSDRTIRSAGKGK